jgi:hypothetical protein
LTSSLGFEWYRSYATISFFCTFFAMLNWFILVVHPEEKGILIEELD